MGANMQKQAVPLVRAEAPYIGTGIEDRAARDAADLIQALEDGEVTEVTGDTITVQYKTLGRKVYKLAKFRRSNQDTCINQRPRVVEGEQVRKGTIIADGPSTDMGELALGKNLLVALMPWEGYNFEDAIILVRAPREGRRADVDPHPRARGRRPRHQARPGGDHAGTSRTCPTTSSPTSTTAASSASAPRSAPATCSSARSRRRARPS